MKITDEKIVQIIFKLYIIDSDLKKFVGYAKWGIDGINCGQAGFDYQLPEPDCNDSDGCVGASGWCGKPIYHNRKEIVSITTEDQVDMVLMEKHRKEMIETLRSAKELKNVLLF